MASPGTGWRAYGRRRPAWCVRVCVCVCACVCTCIVGVGGWVGVVEGRILRRGGEGGDKTNSN